jgi:uncharacterized protein YkwD
VKLRALFTSLSTTLVVAGLAAVWSVASPLSAGCAAATPVEQISPAPSESSQFVASINELRASKGLGPLTVDGNLSSIAQDWAVTMGSQDTIFHRSNLADGVTIDWTRLGENVGMGPTVDDLMNAFINSPHHYENLVDPRFNRIGVGTVRNPDGMMYTAHEFAAVNSSTPAPTPAPTATPKAATAPKTYTPRATTPRVSAPATTAAPTTTTTQPVEVIRSMTHNDELNDGSADDQQQQDNKGNGRCRAHSANNVVV